MGMFMKPLVVSGFLVFGAITSFSAILHVPAHYPTIQAGIDASSNGDTVLVQPGTYFENLDFNGRDIIVSSLLLTTADTSFISATSIDGETSGSVVRFVNGESASAMITGFTIQNGTAENGGGISCNGSDPVIRNNIIRNNSATNSGGGISGNNANFVISGNVISQNTAGNEGGSEGGGISIYYCDNATITDNTITENHCYSGGGISCFDSDPLISGNTISYNTADGGGGIGICCSSAGEISNNVISANEVLTNGGGISCIFDITTAISNNIISGNRGTGDFSYGGAICLIDVDPPITNNTITDNSAQNGGGIACRADSDPVISGNTISGNMAGIGGNVLCESEADPLLTYSIIAFSGGGGGLACDPGSIPELSCCDIYGNTGGDLTGAIADQIGMNGNFSADPMFCETAAGNYHLSLLSHCRASYNSCGVLIGALDIGCTVEYVCGDANGDNEVTWDDVTYLWEFYYTYGPFPEPPDAGDPNCDGLIDISDLVYLAEYLNGTGQEPCCFEGFPRQTAEEETNQHK